MSVETTSDEKIESIKEDIESAIKSLTEIIIDKAWGYENFQISYQEKLIETMNILLKLRNVL